MRLPCDASHLHLQAWFPTFLWTAELSPCLGNTPWRTDATPRLRSWTIYFWAGTRWLAESCSVTQEVRWYHSLQWFPALLRAYLKARPGLWFPFTWHMQTCLWTLQTAQASASHPPTWTKHKRNLCLKLPIIPRQRLALSGSCHFDDFTVDLERQFLKGSLTALSAPLASLHLRALQLLNPFPEHFSLHLSSQSGLLALRP